MKNKELLNICYKFFNRYIIVEELIKQLKKMDLEKYPAKDVKAIEDLIKGIEKIAKDNPNKEDEYVRVKKEQIKKLVDKLSSIPEDDEILGKQITNLKKEHEREIDSHERWFKVTDFINSNKYFNKCFDSLTKYELLEFIAQYIKAPFPPQLSNEEFEELVRIGIEKDEREWLWRLAFNYENTNKNFDPIVDYYIEKKDGYYLTELISALGEEINIDSLIKKLNDKELIKDIEERKDVIKNYVTEEQFKKLHSKIKD